VPSFRSPAEPNTKRPGEKHSEKSSSPYQIICRWFMSWYTFVFLIICNINVMVSHGLYNIYICS
jgi:hypothetical protein